MIITNICYMDMKIFTKYILGAFTLLTSRFLKSRHFDPTIYTCAKIAKFQFHETSVSRNFTIFWLVVRMCDHRLQCMHAAHAVCMRAEDIDTRFKERA